VYGQTDGRVHGRSWGRRSSYRLSASLEPSCIQLLPCSWESQQRVDHIDPRSELFMAAEARRSPPNIPSSRAATWSLSTMATSLPGTLVSVAEGGVLDSVVGFSSARRRFGYPNRRRSAHGLSKACDKAFGSSATSLSIDGSQGGHAPACEWVGRGAIWVTDKVATWR
jgi:hypothetical protein